MHPVENAPPEPLSEPEEAMTFREAISYGLHQMYERHAELRNLSWNDPTISRGSLRAPSSQAELPTIHSSLQRDSSIRINTLLKETGLPYDSALLEWAEKQRHQRERFEASAWSRLFPRLCGNKGETIKLG